MPILKLRSTGRGRRYSVGRGLLESALRVAYRGDWPARLWSVLPRATDVTVSRERVSLPEGPGGSCRVAFVSDLHVGPTTPIALLERTFETLRAERPDVLLLGGDYVYLEAEPHRLAALCDAQSAAAQLDAEAFRIVLCHSPDGLGVLSDLSFQLFLAGHTHGGQIAAPWGPIVLPAGRMCDQYPGGPGHFGSARVYVSRGVGTVELPIRTFAAPEILIVDLCRPVTAGAG